MRNKIILTIGVLVLILGVASLYFVNLNSSQSRPPIRTIDNKGNYIGDKQSGLEPASDEASRFAKTVKGLHEGWENIRLGNSYKRAGQYEEAIQAYKKAYDVDPGNRVFSGRKLIETYEKLSRYDEALSVVDEILKNQPLGEYGVEKYTAIRARLLAAKNQTSTTT